MPTAGRVAALVPAKGFAAAKSRLHGWSPQARAVLARRLLQGVVAALTGSGTVDAVYVVGPPEVAAFARGLGATGWEEGGGGLNAAVDQGLAALGDDRPRLVVMGDLPLLRPVHVARLLQGAGTATVQLCRSLDGTGTNGLWLPAGVAWRSVFGGPGSLAAHLRQARQRALPVRVRALAGFLLDLDTPADFARWEKWKRRAQALTGVPPLPGKGAEPAWRAIGERG